MKNSFILLSVLITGCLVIYYLTGCQDNSTGPTKTNQCLADTTITLTDGFGNILGGDTTQWCYHDSGGVALWPAYPNPTSRCTRVNFYVPSNDTVKLYILKTCTDTLFYFNGPAQRGTWGIQICDSTNQFTNTFQKVYFKSKLFSSSKYCRFYGDIKFTQY